MNGINPLVCCIAVLLAAWPASTFAKGQANVYLAQLLANREFAKVHHRE